MAMARAWRRGEYVPRRKCQACGRVFDLAVDSDVRQWHYGHGCAVRDYYIKL